MAQVANPQNETENKQQALCPFYGSSAGCTYLNNCKLSHSNPNSIALCPQYQTLQGCPTPSACYYRHSLTPLTQSEITKLSKKYNIAGKIHYTRVLKGKSVHRVIIVINQVLWYGIHFIVEDIRVQKIHYQKYSSIYFWNDAILVSEIIGNIFIKSTAPGKYLSYLKSLIDGDIEPGKDKKNKNPKPLIHYRDILQSIGSDYTQIPKPLNPHIVANLSRVPWIDFKLLPLMNEVYDFPDIMLKPGDLVRIWRPKKLVYHCGVYLGDSKIIHISNGISGDQGMSWRISGLFQSGSAQPKQYYDYGKKARKKNTKNTEKQLAKQEITEKSVSDEFERMEYYNDEDDMDLDSDSDNDNESDCKAVTLDETNNRENMKKMELLYQDSDAFESKANMSDIDMEHMRRARLCEWKEFISGSRKKDLELGFFIFPWRTAEDIVYTAQFLTEIHYMKGQYSVYRNNCEHFALYCCTGLRYSPQTNTLEKVMNITNKIGSFAGNILSKFARAKKVKKEEIREVKESENYKNHPIIQSQVMDDGGDEELEQMLSESNGDIISVKKERTVAKILKKPSKKRQSDLISDGENNNVLIDEYANDEFDVLEESIIIEQNNDIHKYASHMKREDLSDITPGGFMHGSSEVLCEKNDTWHV